MFFRVVTPCNATGKCYHALFRRRETAASTRERKCLLVNLVGRDSCDTRQKTNARAEKCLCDFDNIVRSLCRLSAAFYFILSYCLNSYSSTCNQIYCKKLSNCQVPYDIVFFDNVRYVSTNEIRQT